MIGKARSIDNNAIARKRSRQGIEDEIILAGLSGTDDFEAKNLCPCDKADQEAGLIAIDRGDHCPPLRCHFSKAGPDDAVNLFGYKRDMFAGTDRKLGMTCACFRVPGRFYQHIKWQIDDMCNVPGSNVLAILPCPLGLLLAAALSDRLEAGGFHGRGGRSAIDIDGDTQIEERNVSGPWARKLRPNPPSADNAHADWPRRIGRNNHDNSCCWILSVAGSLKPSPNVLRHGARRLRTPTAFANDWPEKHQSPSAMIPVTSGFDQKIDSEPLDISMD